MNPTEIVRYALDNMPIPLKTAIPAALMTFASAAFAQAAPPILAMGHTDRLVIDQISPLTRYRLKVKTPAFRNGADIPVENTQYRGNTYPGLQWHKGPLGTRSYVVIIQGAPDRPGAKTSIHLTLFNIPTTVTRLPAGMIAPPDGAIFGPNVHGLNQPYAGPHTHTATKQAYHLQVFALDMVLSANPKITFETLEAAMAGHVLASGEVIGLAAKPAEAGK